MIPLEEAWNIITRMNDDAHDQSWDTWTEADALADSDDEDDWSAAEELREDASIEQAGYFRDAYYELEPEEQQALWHWAQLDSDFREQFESWFGAEEFANELRHADDSEGGHHD
jgi:hypothetical protein